MNRYSERILDWVVGISQPEPPLPLIDTELTADDIIDDSALTTVEGDRFEHTAVAAVIGDLACSSKPPVNIAVFGPWGSGKSSLYPLLKARIKAEKPDYSVVPYNAWKYGGESLKRNFITSVAIELEIFDDRFSSQLTQTRETSRLSLWAWVTQNWKSIAVGFGLALGVAVLWLAVIGVATWGVQRGSPSTIVLRYLPGAGTVFSVALGALILGPKALESASMKVSELAPVSDDQFVKTFSKLVEKVTHEGDGRLVVFVDELDRCAPEDVVTTLKDLKTFLDEAHCVFVVAADREVLERALRSVEQATPVRPDEPYYSTPGAFLDKIFQHQISLPPLRGGTLTRYARALVLDKKGLWADLRGDEGGSVLLDRVVYTLIPAHVRSPRRVKILINNFATNVRIAQARGFDWHDRAVEIAYLTVLQTEFPAVVADLLSYPRLLHYLLEPPGNLDEELAAVIYQYLPTVAPRSLDDPDVASAVDDSPAGEIMGDEDDDDEKALARARLREELIRFLRKASADGIQPPRADLLYLQIAGAAEGLSDRQLGEVLDYASDTAPADVVIAFDGKPSDDLAIAAVILAQKSDTEYGPGRSNLVETACLLVEKLGAADVVAIQHRVAPTVLAEVAAGTLRVNAVPGAMVLGAAAANDDLMRNLADSLDLDALAEAGVLDRIGRVLQFATGRQAESVRKILGTVYRSAPTPFHLALQTLPAHEARLLWASQEEVVKSVLEDLHAAQSSAESPAATVAGSNPGAVERARDRMGDLLAAVENRTDPDPQLLSDVLATAQTADDESRDLAFQRARDDLAIISDPSLVNVHAFFGIWGGAQREIGWWTSQVVPGHEQDPVALWAMHRLINDMPSMDIDYLGAALRAVDIAAPFVVESTDAPSLIDAAREALAKTSWIDDSSESHRRRRMLHAAIRSVYKLRPDEFGSVLADDIDGAIQLNPEDSIHGLILELSEELPIFVAKDLDTTIANSGEDSVIKGRARIRLRRHAELRPLDGALVRDILQTVTPDLQLVDDWLASAPSVGDVLKVLAVQLPTLRVLDSYAASLKTDSGRSRIWMDLEARAARIAALRAVGRHGVTRQVFEAMTPRVLAGSTQDDRDRQAERLLSATPGDPEAVKVLADLAEELLEKRIGDALIAAKIVIHAGGVPRGYLVRMRAKFDRVFADKRRIPKQLRNDLVELRLLSKPKNLIDRLLGKG